MFRLQTSLLLLFGSAMMYAQMPPPINSSQQAEDLSANISDKHGILTSKDSTCLFFRYWPATASGTPVKAVVVLHGIGYHSGPYRVIADGMNEQNIHVYALDARGHGLSCGPRGYIGTTTQALDDVSAMVQFVKKQLPSAKVYLLGESMGGAFALNYARENSDQISGLILLAPAFSVNRHQLLKIGNITLLPYLLFAHRRPAISLVDKRLEESTRDPQFVVARRSDPLAYKRISFDYLWEIRRLVKNWKTDIAPRLRTPTLIVQGGNDLIVSHNDCKAFARVDNNLDREYQEFADARHTTLWDPDTAEILKSVQLWIDKH